MSETSSDTESSCGWTIISNEGSDIETLGPEAAVEYGAEPLQSPAAVETELQDPPASLTAAGRAEERGGDTHDDTLKEQTLDEPLSTSKAGCGATGKAHVTQWSSSDHSDIVTLGDMKEEEHPAVEEEAAASEDFYLGTSCSSQYAFTPVETVFPVQQPAVSNSSSSEDEAVGSATTVVRRRRLRKSTTCMVTEPEEEARESGPSEEEEEEVREEAHREEQTGVQPVVTRPLHSHVSGTLNKCILLALVIAVSMGFGHFYGTIQVQERQKTVEKIRVNELGDVRDLLQQHLKEEFFTSQEDVSLREDLDERDVVLSITGIMEKITKENQDLRFKLAQIQTQRDEQEKQLKLVAAERMNMESWQQKVTSENQLLKNSLEHEEKSLSTLQEELRNLRSKIRELEDRGAGADSMMSENQRLKDQVEEEKQLIRVFLGQREGLMAEVQTLRKELDKEKGVTDRLRKELNQLSSASIKAGEEATAETEELNSRLMELEKKLSFEQQRSDLWERLYVETKEERAKGDTQPKIKKSKESMTGKMKETFDAVKNSTKEFVHHHKEQIKKAKEAVKENLRKFSDSVKSTFRHFKDSASTLLKKARGSYSRKFDDKDAKESWQHRSHKPHHRHPHKSTEDSFQGNQNTRKSGGKVHEDRDTNTHKAPKGCSGVFDCAYQESMSLFNKAMEPIRADEFHKLLQSYLQQEVDHFHHWKELEKFINSFFHNGLFIHDQMLFTDFVSGVEDYLEDMHEYHGLDDDVFEDLDEYVYRHFFGDTYSKNYGPSRPFERSDTDAKEELRGKQQQRKQQRARPRPQRERKWNRSGRNADRHMADVKIELGPMPFDPKY